MVRRSRNTPPADLESLLTAAELAEYLRLNERTLLKLAGQGELPGVRLGNQWRFRRSVVDAWLDDRMLGVRSSELQSDSTWPATFSFEEGFRPDHVIATLRSRHKAGVLEELSARAAELGLIRDKTWFLGALLERENVLSSAVGAGVAFPHTLQRHPEQVVKPFLLVGRCHDGIDFAEPDSEPVRIVVLMGLRYQQLHLPWLSRLSALLRDAEIRSRLHNAESAIAIHELMVREVRRLQLQ